MGWTVTGTAGGRPFTLTYANRFADLYDISYASTNELFTQLNALQTNPFAAVAFTDVRIRAQLSAQFRQYRILALELQQAGQWVPIDPSTAIVAMAGQRLVLRARLSSYQDTLGSRTVQFALTVPAAAAGSSATLLASGGAEGAALPNPRSSFTELLDSLQNAPRNDEILAELFGENFTQPPLASARRRLADVVTGAISVPVNIQAPETSATRTPNATLLTIGGPSRRSNPEDYAARELTSGTQCDEPVETRGVADRHRRRLNTRAHSRG